MRWRERRAWAERLLMEQFNVADLGGVFRLGRGVELEVPGTQWRCKTHGIGIRVYRTDEYESGGIDFDLDTPDPDAWRLSELARLEVEEGTLAPERYAQRFFNLDRLRTTLAEVLASESRL